MKTNYLICPGGTCPLRMTCQRFQAWLNRDDDSDDEMIPAFKGDTCERYLMKEYYGG